MSSWLLAVVTVIYVGVATAYWIEGRPGMAVAFAGYAAANIGFIWESACRP